MIKYTLSLMKYIFTERFMKHKRLIITILFFVFCLVLTSCSLSANKHSKYYNQNVESLSLVVDKELAQLMIASFEEINIVDDNTKITKEDIYVKSDTDFEVYLPLMIHCSVINEKFVISTYETTYNEDTAIILYDSTSPENKIRLTKEEINTLRISQRQTIVHNTISISPSTGLILHNALGVSKFTFTFTNLSDSAISTIMIVVTPYIIGGDGYTYKNAGYTLVETLDIGQSINKSLSISTWSNYDMYKISEVTIMFSDGSAVKFDQFDCQFLDDK